MLVETEDKAGSVNGEGSPGVPPHAEASANAIGDEDNDEGEEGMSEGDDAALDVSLPDAGSLVEQLQGLFQRSPLQMDRCTSEWEEQWRTFMARRGILPPVKMPVIARVSFDPYTMFLRIYGQGGLRKVVGDKGMHDVVKAGFGENVNRAYFRTIVQRVKDAYIEWLLPLEAALSIVSSDLRAVLRPPATLTEGVDRAGVSTSVGYASAISTTEDFVLVNAGDHRRDFEQRDTKSEGFDKAADSGNRMTSQLSTLNTSALDREGERAMPEEGEGGVAVLETLGREEWCEQWGKFRESRGGNTVWPSIAGRVVDLYKLFYMVEADGGVDEVSRKRRWREMARCLGFLPGASATVKHHYIRQLLSFHNHLKGIDEAEIREEMFVDDPLDMPNNLLLQECKTMSDDLSAQGNEVESSINAASAFLQSLSLGSLCTGSTLALAVTAPDGVRQDDSEREGCGPEGEEWEASVSDPQLQERTARSAELDAASSKLANRVKSVLNMPLRPPNSVGVGRTAGENFGEKGDIRKMVPLYRQGSTLYCKGDCVTITSEEDDVPFLAQLLNYDRVKQRLEVRWLYRLEEVESSAGPVLQRYRRKHFPADDVFTTHSEWNGEHEVFFSFHVDKDVHINSVIGLVTVYFLEGYPLDAQVRLQSGEYYCRSIWDPTEKLVFYFGEKDFKKDFRRIIVEELQHFPYPYPQLPSKSVQTQTVSQVGTAIGAGSASGSGQRQAQSPGRQKQQHVLQQQQLRHQQTASQVQLGREDRLHYNIQTVPLMGPDTPGLPAAIQQAASNPERRMRPLIKIKMGSYFDEVPSLPYNFLQSQETTSPEENARQWLQTQKSSGSGEGLAMDTDFDAWHDHMRSVWQRQADVRKQKRSLLERSADEREEMSTKERTALKLEEARMVRILRKLRQAIDDAQGPTAGGVEGDEWRNAAAAVGRRLAGSLPHTWTVSMIHDEDTSRLRVLYRPPARPPAPQKDSSLEADSTADASAATPAPEQVVIKSITQVQQYLANSPDASVKGKINSLGRSFLPVEDLLLREVEERKSRFKSKRAKSASVEVQMQTSLLAEEDMVNKARECLLMLNRRKSDFEKHLKEAEDWRALLLQKNTQLKQAMRCVQPTNCVLRTPKSLLPSTTADESCNARIRSSRHASERRVGPASRTNVCQRSGRIITEYPMDKAQLPSPKAFGAFLRAVRAVDSVYGEAHSGEVISQRWTRLRRSCNSHTTPCTLKQTVRNGIGVKNTHWKPRFGRIWWEDMLRENVGPLHRRTSSIGSDLKRLTQFDTDTDTESESEVVVNDTGGKEVAGKQTGGSPKIPSEYVGQRVQRCSLDAEGHAVATAIATVSQYVDASNSGFVSAKTGRPAGLWRIKYHDDALGEEELEEDELIEAHLAHEGAALSQSALQRDASSVSGWQVSGHPLIGRVVRRGIMDRHSTRAPSGGLAGFVDGTIRAWLPPEASNYFPKDSLSPQPLFRVVYHRKDIGVEDLDLDEAQQAGEAYTPLQVAETNDEWLSCGSTYVGQRVRRSVVDGSGRMSAVDGMVRGWLPAELSNFWSDHTGKPAALWRVVYDNDLIGQEDLEDFEVEEAVQIYQLEVVRAAAKSAAQGGVPTVAVPASAKGVPVHVQRSEIQDEWLKEGHTFIGLRVRRSIQDQRKTMSADVDGTVIGWLPAHLSNYFKDDDPNQPAALWRVQYDSPAVGQEDLEHSEVVDAAAMYKTGAGGRFSTAGSSAALEPRLADTSSKDGNKPAADDASDEWWTSGNEFVGRRVRRFILDDQGQVIDTADAMIRGWLPAHVSNFFDEQTGEPAALWRIRYDNERIGEEDLELSEVEEALELLGKDMKVATQSPQHAEKSKAPASFVAEGVKVEKQSTAAGPAQSMGSDCEQPVPQPDAPRHGQHNGEDEKVALPWRADGSDFIGKRIRRIYMDGPTQSLRPVDGTVISWVSASDSCYVSETTGEAAALWTVKYDDELIGEEELEVSEVQQALLVYQKEANAAGHGDERVVGDTNTASTAQEEGEWLTTGSIYLGKRVRRPVPTQSTGKTVWLDATVKGWLPADKSDFYLGDVENSEPAALWRAAFDDVRAGEEDLEEHEVLEGIAVYEQAGITGKSPVKGSNRRASRQGSGQLFKRNRTTTQEKEIKQKPVVDTEKGGVSSKKDKYLDGWMVTGSKHLTKRVRRSMSHFPSLQGSSSKWVVDEAWLHGEVTGWLPAHMSNFFKDPLTRFKPEPLWRVEYDGVEEQEDLEEEEVIEAIQEHKRWRQQLLDKDEWLTTGSEFLKKRLRKSVPNQFGEEVWLNATVLGWLPPEQSNFFPDPMTKIPAALYRIVFDDERVGAEDLEEHEVEQFMQKFKDWKAAKLQSTKRSSRNSVRNSPSKRQRKHVGQEASKEVWSSPVSGRNVQKKGCRISEDQKTRNVKQLRGKKIENGKILYQVQWKGCTSEDDTWEEAAALGKDEWLVSEWEEEQRNANPPSTHKTPPDQDGAGKIQRAPVGEAGTVGGGNERPFGGQEKVEQEQQKGQKDVEEGKDKEETRQEEDLHEWHTTGSDWIGVQVLADVPTDEGSQVKMIATVVGWLPASESNFLDDNQQPAPLWRVRFNTADVGCADLEAYEVDAAILALQASTAKTSQGSLNATGSPARKNGRSPMVLSSDPDADAIAGGRGKRRRLSTQRIFGDNSDSG